MKPIRVVAIGIALVFGSAYAQSGAQLLASAHVKYVPPPGWVVEDFPDHTGTFMYALRGPNDVEASIGIEVAAAPEGRALEEILEQFIARARKDVGQRAWKRSFGKTRGGAPYGRLEYLQVRSGVRSVESFTVLPLLSRQSVYVYTSIAEADIAKHEKTSWNF